MICICIPSRGRPSFIPGTVSSILDRADNKKNVIVKYYINDDDPDLKSYISYLKNMQNVYGDSVQYIVGPDQSPVYSWNLIAESTKADFYMLAGDEVTFKTKGWDKTIKECKEKYPDGIFVVAAYDDRGSHTHGRCTQPFVTKEWAKALGYHWNPAFFHWNIDEYTGELCKAIDRFIYLKDVVIKCTKIKDPTGARLRKPGLFNRDKWVYDKLMQNNFDSDITKLGKSISEAKA